MKRFKAKKKQRNYKIFIYLFMFVLSFSATVNLVSSDEEYETSNVIGMVLSEILGSGNIIVDAISEKIAEPSEMIYSSFNSVVSKNNLSVFSNIEDDNFDYSNELSEYVEDPNPTYVDDPIVYIYNTHQTEEYSIDNPLDYSVKPNVMIASYIMKDYFNSNGINAIVETSNIKDYLDEHGLSYSYSYTASKYFLEQAMKEYETLEYFIDIHRDSATIDYTYLEYEGESYARVLFVIGMNHDNSDANLAFVNLLNELLEEAVPGISRGIMQKSGSNVNGIYNQDVSEHAILLEVGGVDNQIEEVNNTILLVSEIITNYIKGQ